MKIAKVLVAWVVASGSIVFAQTASPTVAPFPLEITRPVNLSVKQRDELNSTFKVLLRRSGAITPDGARLKVALAETRREDCDRDDQCLAQLALHAGTLYAVFASVKLTAEGEVVAYGRVVRDDGKLVSALPTGEMVRMPKGKAAFPDVAENALQALLERLNVRALPLSKPVESVVVEKPPELVKPPERVEPPPPLPPLVVEDTAAPRRTTGKTLVIVGGGVLLVGGVVGAAGLGIAGTLTAVDGAVPENQANAVRTSRTLKTSGLIVMGAGAALAAVGAAIWATAPSAPGTVHAFLSPQADGAVVGISGAF